MGEFEVMLGALHFSYFNYGIGLYNELIWKIFSHFFKSRSNTYLMRENSVQLSTTIYIFYFIFSY
jgi:hypothetical protein